jgi:hypothetical protein
MVALRGSSVTRAISPKNCPGPSRDSSTRGGPSATTATSPSTMT